MSFKDQLTVVVPCKLDSQDRLENLMAHIEYVRHITNNRVILVECDTEPKLYDILKIHKHFRYLFVEVESDQFWSRSLALNQGVLWATTPIVATWDVDVVIDPAQVEATTQEIIEDRADIALPFSKVHFCIHAVGQEVRNNTLNYDDLGGRYLHTVVGRDHFGCANIFKRAVYRHIRGMSERFFGWGGEDAEIGSRVTKLGYRIFRHPGFAWHIDHSRCDRSGHGNNDWYRQNQEEVCKVDAMSREELLAYFGISPTPGDYLS